MGAMKAWLEDLHAVVVRLEAEQHPQAEPLRDLYDRLTGPHAPKPERRQTLRPRWRR